MTQTPLPPSEPHEREAGRHRPLHDLAQLRRSVTDRRVAGVAGGLGRHLDIDPTIVRVVLVVLCFFGGAGFLLYVVAWLLVPDDGRDAGRIRTTPSTRSAVLVGTGVAAGLLLLSHSWRGFGLPWPLLVVGAGVLVYLAVSNGPQPGSGSPGTGQDSAPPVPPPTAPAPGGRSADPSATPPWLPPVPAAAAVREPPRRKRGPRLFGPTLAVVAVVLGALGIVDATGGDVAPAAYAALALAIVGAVLVLGSVLGRPGGLILLGVVALLSLSVTTAVSGGRGFDDHGPDRLHVTPASAAGVRDFYFVPAGRAVVDLSRVGDPAALAGRTIEVGARAGEIELVLPPGVTSRVRAEVTGPGQIDLPGRLAGGIGVTLHDDLGSGPGTVTIRTHLFAGHIDVRNP